MNASAGGDVSDSNWLVVTPDVRIPLTEFTFTFVRSSGPGGQNVNKVNTKVRLRWPVAGTSSLGEELKHRFLTKYHRRVTTDGDFILTSQRYRDQSRNVTDCLEKLRVMLVEAAAPRIARKKTKPSKASRQRRLKEKRAQSTKKQSRRPPGLDE